jgi:subtilisin family serine protease
VAKKTSIYGVKVLSNQGSGSTSAIVSGMDFVASDSSSRSCPRGVFVNMSLGGGYSAALNNAARNMVSRGIFLAVAAGNDNRDAANTSPASEATACTVGATTSSDSRASFSNYGRVVDIFAPGQSITSLRPGGGTVSQYLPTS